MVVSVSDVTCPGDILLAHKPLHSLVACKNSLSLMLLWIDWTQLDGSHWGSPYMVAVWWQLGRVGGGTCTHVPLVCLGDGG